MSFEVEVNISVIKENIVELFYQGHNTKKWYKYKMF